MKVALDPRFDEQREQFSFCFTCEHCVHFDPTTGLCLHEYPNEMHRLSYYDGARRPGAILFCKEFDLG